MVWVIAFGELFFGDLWCVVWGYGGMRTHFSLLNPPYPSQCKKLLAPEFSSLALPNICYTKRSLPQSDRHLWRHRDCVADSPGQMETSPSRDKVQHAQLWNAQPIPVHTGTALTCSSPSWARTAHSAEPHMNLGEWDMRK